MTSTTTTSPVRVTSTVPEGYFDQAVPITVIMGVCGCGKTTVSTQIAERLGWESAEADDFHPQANIDKMSRGIPLTDEDRWGWLDQIAAWIKDHIERGVPGTVTCSALKRVYRDKLRMPGVVFVYMDGDYDTVQKRLSARQGHFMKADMLDSQFAILEPPSEDEVHLDVDLNEGGTPEQEADAIIAALGLHD